ncbi:MAG: UDP-3-O-(3-hydroxymyristoyl)glucosamine N-acyltransferase, partial [Colwellia sp.]|nr:UDP-3-O-(3-hydroxymyristoyl)glucosamine N-acyltransferase [Colwellia sp.]
RYINSVATLANAKSGQIAFLANSKYRQQLTATQASAVIISPDCVTDCPSHALVMDNPYMGYALVAQLLDTTPAPATEIHPSAIIDSSAQLAANVCIGANSVIEAGAVISEGVCIGAGCFIGQNVNIGANTNIWSNVSIYHQVVIGENCCVQANTVIGSDGFGYAKNKGQWIKIPQLGSVIIGNRVEIGASTTIDRGALDSTIIKDGVILDNQIQIAHNVVIGENTAIAACSVIAGSTTVGKNCTVAGLVGINGHITIVDGCVFTGMTMVTKNMVKPGVYSSGMPAADNREWNKTNARIRKLESLTKRVKELEGQLSLLKN